MSPDDNKLRSSERHARIKQIFLAVCDHHESRRAEMLQELCGHDGDLRREVERLLVHQSLPANTRSTTTTNSAGTTIPIGREDEAPVIDEITDGSRQFTPGTLISRRYRIVCLLGKGGMGEVFRADDLTLGQRVALKFLPRKLAAESHAIQRLRQEVRMAHAVTSPYVCRVYDLGCVDGDYFMSMEYVDGETLQSLLRRIGRLPYEKAVRLAGEICAGLATAHAKGIVHRDLKPANIMIDGRGHARITDFGLAAFGDAIASAGICAGTPDYMSPEQLAGTGVDMRSDIYALGLVLYEMFTGEPAIRGRLVGESGSSPENSESRLLDATDARMDPELERVILQCLSVDRADRPASALEVAAALPGLGPLAAAVAAGDTLPPEIIAEGSRLPPAAPARAPRGLGLTVYLALIALVAGLSSVTHPLQRGTVDAPNVLAERARRVMERLGLPPARHEAFGLKSLGESDAIADADHQAFVLATCERDRNPPVFWYRSSDQPFVPAEPSRLVFGSGRVSASDPPIHEPGDCEIVLDASGRLLAFMLIAEAPTGPHASWNELMRMAQLDVDQARPAKPAVDSPVPFEQQRAWTFDAVPASQLRLETAALNGQPVFFALIDSTSALAGAALGGFVWRRDVLWWSEAVLVTVLAAMSLPLAVRNMRRGRSDHRGAFRLGLFILGLRVLSWLLQASHGGPLRGEMTRLLLMVSGALAEASLISLLYLALEPYVRRLWPQALVSWVRVLQGRFRDTRVARDIFSGCLLGAALALLFRFEPALTALLGTAPRPVFRVDEFYLPLDGIRPAVAFWCDALRKAVYFSLAFTLLTVLLRRRLGHMPAAGFCAVLILSPLFVPRGSHPISSIILIGGGCLVAMVWSMMRLGVLPLVAAMFVAILLIRFPLTLDARMWYSDSSLLVLLLTIALGIAAFVMSGCRRRPAW